MQTLREIDATLFIDCQKINVFGCFVCLMVILTAIQLCLENFYTKLGKIREAQLRKIVVLYMNSIIRLGGFYCLHEAKKNWISWEEGFHLNCDYYFWIQCSSVIYIALMFWETIYIRNLSLILFLHHIVVGFGSYNLLYDVPFFNVICKPLYMECSWLCIQSANFAGINCALWLVYFHYDIPKYKFFCCVFGALSKAMTVLLLGCCLVQMHKNYGRFEQERFGIPSMVNCVGVAVVAFIIEIKMCYSMVQLGSRKFEEWRSASDCVNTSFSSPNSGILYNRKINRSQ